MVDTTTMMFENRIVALFLTMLSAASAGVSFADSTHVRSGYAEKPGVARFVPDHAPVRSSRFPKSYEFARHSSKTMSSDVRHVVTIGKVVTKASGSTDSVSLRAKARVLPMRTLVVSNGQLKAIYSNSREWDIVDSLFTVRRGSIDGPPLSMTDGVWKQAQSVLSRASEPYGLIYP
jgi:hypothetical protein